MRRRLLILCPQTLGAALTMLVFTEGFTISHLQEKPQSGSTEASPLLTLSPRRTRLVYSVRLFGGHGAFLLQQRTKGHLEEKHFCDWAAELFFLEAISGERTADRWWWDFLRKWTQWAAASRTDSVVCLCVCVCVFFDKDKLQAFKWKSEFWITYFCQGLPTLKMFLWDLWWY